MRPPQVRKCIARRVWCDGCGGKADAPAGRKLPPGWVALEVYARHMSTSKVMEGKACSAACAALMVKALGGNKNSVLGPAPAPAGGS